LFPSHFTHCFGPEFLSTHGQQAQQIDI